MKTKLKEVKFKFITFGRITTYLFKLSILVCILAFNLSDNPPSGWYQQFMPNFNNFNLADTFFLDSLNGWAVTGNDVPNDSSGYILKTTNGGNNWVLQFSDVRDFTRVIFLNYNTGFVSGQYGNGAKLYKTTNGGNNWFSINIPGGGQLFFNDMSVLNEDTIWYACEDGLVGGVFRTTNGGQSWTPQLQLGSQNPTKIYFFNKDLGFISKGRAGGDLRRTTNSGLTWTLISGSSGFDDIFFIDTLTGWKTPVVKKTTDGGLTWINQQLPEGGILLNYGLSKFSKISRDTIMGVGEVAMYSNFQYRGVIFKTTNGGNNWIYQIPDTSINIWRYYHINFVNGKIGWAFETQPSIHTTTGGDPIWLTGLIQISTTVPDKFMLYQNYPNPFNPVTRIKYQIVKTGFITLIVYDIQGKEMVKLVSNRQQAGTYEVDFPGYGLPSGAYFYSLFSDGKLIDTKKMIFLR